LDYGDQMLEPAQSILGRVLDLDGTPRGGVAVLARPAFCCLMNPGLDTLLHEATGNLCQDSDTREVRTTSAADGTFRLGTLDVDVYAVFADAPDREPACAREVRAGTVDLVLRLPAVAASALLTIVDGTTGLPIADAKATARRRVREDGDARTDFDPDLEVLSGDALLDALRTLPPRTATDAAASPADDVTPAAATTAPAGLLLVRRAGSVRTDVIVSAPGYGTHGFRLKGVEPGKLIERTLTLWRESVLAGRVLDDEGHPVAGARVECTPPEKQRVPLDPRSVTSSADGGFRFGALTSGEWALSAGKDLWISGQPRAAFVRRGQVREEMDIVLTRGATLRGRVFDARGEPAADETVWVEQGVGDESTGSHAETDDGGRFRVEGLDAGMATVSCSSSTPVVTALAPAQTASVELWLRAPPMVTGCVLRNGQPVPGALITGISFSNRQVISTALRDGTFVLQLSCAGEWALTAAAGTPCVEATTAPVPVSLNWNERRSVDLVFGGVRVSGHVLDAISRQPASQAEVWLWRLVAHSGPAEGEPGPWNEIDDVDSSQLDRYLQLRRSAASVTTDGEGRFRFDGLQPGDYRLAPRAGENIGTPVALTVGSESPAEVELELPASQGLSGTVRTASGSPLPPATRIVVSCDGIDGLWQSFPDSDGAWSCELPAGTFRLRVVQDLYNSFGDEESRELGPPVSVKLEAGEADKPVALVVSG
ncbi:MAG TPA: carboxypeptidase-like regulatory domain-containing protein, partial [Planctomycetota bacterium]|nr:carboxypeptidase-like regulatory domain-containing protein [Planctomycetota bacterium]